MPYSFPLFRAALARRKGWSRGWGWGWGWGWGLILALTQDQKRNRLEL